MSKVLTILDKDYTQWVENLSARYRQSQIRASVKVNREMLKYYWELGRDIEEMRVEEAEKLGVKLGDFMMPIRMAVTGSRISPPLIGSIWILGKEKSIARIEKTLKAL